MMELLYKARVFFIIIWTLISRLCQHCQQGSHRFLAIQFLVFHLLLDKYTAIDKKKTCMKSNNAKLFESHLTQIHKIRFVSYNSVNATKWGPAFYAGHRYIIQQMNLEFFADLQSSLEQVSERKEVCYWNEIILRTPFSPYKLGNSLYC